ncbi:DUF6538 domain-containing protein [Roseibium album]|uniref:DUF6538 domain-containing protein n=1 Tax=Roseibium album TaxID=311410 RepID=UPI0032997202
MRKNYLYSKNGRWYCKLNVPADLQQIVGKTRLKKSLQTSDRRVAAVKAPGIIAGWKLGFDQLRSGDPIERWIETHKINTAGQESDQLEVIQQVMSDQLIERDDLSNDKKRLALSVASGRAILLRDIARKYLESLEGRVQEKTIIIYRQALELAAIIQPDALKWDRRLAQRTLNNWISEKAQNTVAKRFSALKGLFHWAADNEFIPEGNAELFDRLRYPKRAPVEALNVRPYSPEESQRLIALCRDSAPKLWPLVALLAHSGMRLDEPLRLTTDRLEFHSDELLLIHIDKAKTAAGKRVVPVVNRPLIKHLAEHRCQDFAILLGKGKSANTQPSGKAATKISRLVRSKLTDDPKISPAHSLRHMVAFEARKAGHRPDDIRDYLGHEQQDVTLGRYARGSFDLDALVSIARSMHRLLDPDTD